MFQAPPTSYFRTTPLHHLLVDGLVEEDDAADVVVQLFAAGEEQLAVRPTILLNVLDVDLRQTLANRRYTTAETSSSCYSKGSSYSITEHRVPELIPVLGSQPAGDVRHKPCGRLPLLSTRPAVTLPTLKRATTNFAAW